MSQEGILDDLLYSFASILTLLYGILRFSWWPMQGYNTEDWQ